MTTLLVLAGCAVIALGVLSSHRRARPARRSSSDPRFIYVRSASRSARLPMLPLALIAALSVVAAVEVLSL